MGTVLTANALAILILMLALWQVSLALQDVSIVDIAWGPAFVVVAWLTWTLAGAPGNQGDVLLPMLTTIWGLRLAGYLARRKRGEGEDRRYAAMRSRRGAAFWWQSLFVVFLLQGALVAIISLPLQFGITAPSRGHAALSTVGLVLWFVGLVFESVGDWQLTRFRRDPANRRRVMDQGLWRFTRHPNYFGDFCVWWGLGLVAWGRGAPVWALVGPLVMSVLLLRVSGVTLLEASLRSSKPDYEEYARRTNAFIPWWPRSPRS